MSIPCFFTKIHCRGRVTRPVNKYQIWRATADRPYDGIVFITVGNAVLGVPNAPSGA